MCCKRKVKRGYALPAVVVLMMMVFKVFLILSNITVNLYNQYKYCYKSLDNICERPIEEYDLQTVIKSNLSNLLEEKGIKIRGIKDLRSFLEKENFKMLYEGFEITYSYTSISQKFVAEKKSTGKRYDFYIMYENKDIEIIYKENGGR